MASRLGVQAPIGPPTPSASGGDGLGVGESESPAMHEQRELGTELEYVGRGQVGEVHLLLAWACWAGGHLANVVFKPPHRRQECGLFDHHPLRLARAARGVHNESHMTRCRRARRARRHLLPLEDDFLEAEKLQGAAIWALQDRLHVLSDVNDGSKSRERRVQAHEAQGVLVVAKNRCSTRLLRHRSDRFEAKGRVAGSHHNGLAHAPECSSGPGGTCLGKDKQGVRTLHALEILCNAASCGLWQRLQSKTSQPRAKVMRHPARLRVGGPGGLPKYLDLVLAITMHHPLELSSSHAREGRVACKGHQQRLVHGLTLWKRGGDEGSSSAMGRMWSQDHRSPAPNDLDQGDYQPDSRKGHQEPHKQVEEPAQGHQGVEPRRYSHWPGES
mmetsp:Transcript_26819/g.78080  ORF Transcript_26819/g.78080 Transcript_26819/m.78080 type:complete len:387 (-) Transcript_26819:91-1251(-)